MYNFLDLEHCEHDLNEQRTSIQNISIMSIYKFTTSIATVVVVTLTLVSWMRLRNLLANASLLFRPKSSPVITYYNYINNVISS